jgi:carbonic anhydrase
MKSKSKSRSKPKSTPKPKVTMNVKTKHAKASAAADPCKDQPFTYADQESWCGQCNEAGRMRQAPINIVTSQARPVDSLPLLDFSGYSDTKLVPYRKYHNLKVDCSGGSSFITIGTERVRLVEFHLHRPSEEEIDGQRTAMVIHLVHEKTAAGSTPVVAILVNVGQPNENISTIVDSLIQNAPVINGQFAPQDVDINPADLLPPADPEGRRGYYRYEGSLTTPGCEEGITFYVLKTKVTFSGEQYDQFEKRYPFANARDIQPTNGRPVEQTRY